MLEHARTVGPALALTLALVACARSRAVAPRPAPGPTDASATRTPRAVDLAAGDGFACAVLDDRSVRCWGRNDEGLFADGTRTPRAAPHRIDALEGFEHLAFEALVGCGIKGGEVYCWGPYVGPGATAGGPVRPLRVRGLTDVREIVLREMFASARRGDGSVWVWRTSPTTTPEPPEGTPETTPARRPAYPAAARIGGSAQAFCAITAGGEAHCLGETASHMLMTAPGAPLLTPQRLPLSGAVAEVGFGFFTGCARMADGAVRCWGDDQTLGRTAAPTDARELIARGAVGLAVGFTHTCAALGDGGARCWGARTRGLAGDVDDNVVAVEPVAVAGVADAVQVVTGRHAAESTRDDPFACARSGDGVVSCWGGNRGGQLGAGDRVAYRAEPAPVAGLREVAQIAASGRRTCAARRDGTVACWGGRRDGRLDVAPVTVAGLRDVVEVALADTHACARLRDGAVRCWGENAAGQRGPGEPVTAEAPAALPGVTDAAQLALTFEQTCVRGADASVRCWGRGTTPRLASTRPAGRGSPTLVASGSDVLVVGAQRLCVRDARGLRCGVNEGATPDASDPTSAAVLRRWSRGALLAVSSGAACARVDGAAWCVGATPPAGDEPDDEPQRVPELDAAAQVALGEGHHCAATAEGVALCWGADPYGESSPTAARPPVRSPRPVAGVSEVTQVAVGDAHACALRRDGAVWCWGSDEHGELGTGAPAWRGRAAPVRW